MLSSEIQELIKNEGWKEKGVREDVKTDISIFIIQMEKKSMY